MKGRGLVDKFFDTVTEFFFFYSSASADRQSILSSINPHPTTLSTSTCPVLSLLFSTSSLLSTICLRFLPSLGLRGTTKSGTSSSYKCTIAHLSHQPAAAVPPPRNLHISRTLSTDPIQGMQALKIVVVFVVRSLIPWASGSIFSSVDAAAATQLYFTLPRINFLDIIIARHDHNPRTTKRA